MKYINIKSYPIKVETQYQGRGLETVTLINHEFLSWNHDTWITDADMALLKRHGIPFEIKGNDRRQEERRRG